MSDLRYEGGWKIRKCNSSTKASWEQMMFSRASETLREGLADATVLRGEYPMKAGDRQFLDTAKAALGHMSYECALQPKWDDEKGHYLFVSQVSAGARPSHPVLTPFP